MYDQLAVLKEAKCQLTMPSLDAMNIHALIIYMWTMWSMLQGDADNGMYLILLPWLQDHRYTQMQTKWNSFHNTYPLLTWSAKHDGSLWKAKVCFAAWRYDIIELKGLVEIKSLTIAVEHVNVNPKNWWWVWEREREREEMDIAYLVRS